MKLTQHFELNEFTRSATAKANGISNSLNPNKADDRIVIENLQHLCQTVLEPLREFVSAPMVVEEETFDKSSDLSDKKSLLRPTLRRYSSVIPPCLHRSVENRWTSGGQSVEA